MMVKFLEKIYFCKYLENVSMDLNETTYGLPIKVSFFSFFGSNIIILF